MNKKKILVIVGPTAAGKSDISLLIAQEINAEIISADSRQIFRYMNICTAKPSAEELERIPHHFIDIVDPDQSYNAGQFGAEGRAKINEILARGREVIVVGGSGLYIRSLIDGLFGEPARDEELRQKIREGIEEFGTGRAYDRLKAIDPEAASKIHPNDAKRIERALEVYELTGKKISELRQAPSVDVNFEPVMVGLTYDRMKLYKRIEDRVDRMITAGVVEETKFLIEKGYSPKLISMESLGYREIIQYLNNKMSYEKMIAQFKQGSRNYAKRQLTWFRKDTRIEWFDVSNFENAAQLAVAITAGKETSAKSGEF